MGLKRYLSKPRNKVQAPQLADPPPRVNDKGKKLIDEDGFAKVVSEKRGKALNEEQHLTVGRIVSVLC